MVTGCNWIRRRRLSTPTENRFPIAIPIEHFCLVFFLSNLIWIHIYVGGFLLLFVNQFILWFIRCLWRLRFHLNMKRALRRFNSTKMIQFWMKFRRWRWMWAAMSAIDYRSWCWWSKLKMWGRQGLRLDGISGRWFVIGRGRLGGRVPIGGLSFGALMRNSHEIQSSGIAADAMTSTYLCGAGRRKKYDVFLGIVLLISWDVNERIIIHGLCAGESREQVVGARSEGGWRHHRHQRPTDGESEQQSSPQLAQRSGAHADPHIETVSWPSFDLVAFFFWIIILLIMLIRE